MSRTTRPTDEISFEDAMQRLDEIVGGMETDRMPLEEMIRSYEEGVTLLKSCRQRLENARRRVEVISADLETTKATTAPFDAADAGDEEDGAPSRTAAPRRRKAAESEEIRLF